MTDQELESRLARAVNQAAPNDLEKILSRCEERSESQEGKGIPMTKTKTARRFHWRALIAACLALALIGGGTGIFYQQATAVTSVISIDVNPSIELRVNKDEKVLSCTPLNEDAHIALTEMNDGKDLKGAKLNVAVNAVVGALVRHGYLDGLSSAILVSVEDKDQARATRMEEELRTAISNLLEVEAPNTTVLSQTVTTEPGDIVYQWGVNGGYFVGHHDEGDHHEEDHHISSGKAALVNKVMQMNGTIAMNSTTAYDHLCGLTVEELNDLLELGETRIPIGKSAAALIVEEYAGTLALDSAYTEVDTELDEGIYEVELHTAWGEFEYRV
ncbi:MAG: hypothetical protein K2F83_08035, partial [Oscillospiraceae bacterium]|nr:hypothetical protein [Oscillospiraceae bacterium]